MKSPSGSSRCALIDQSDDANESYRCWSQQQYSVLFGTLYLKQAWLFSGYMRRHISPHLIATLIPLEVIELCELFFIVKDDHDSALVSKYSRPHGQVAMGEHYKFKLYMYDFAVRCYKKGEYWLAYELFHALCACFPDEAVYHNCRALILDRWNMVREAERAYQTATQLNSSSHIYKFNYAILLRKLQKYPQSLQLLQQSHLLAPTVSLYAHKISECFVHMDDIENALLYHAKAVELHNPQSMHSLIEFGKFFCSLRRFVDARVWFDKALEQEDEKNWKRAYRIAKHLRDECQCYCMAEKYYLLCMQLQPQSGHVCASYAYLLFLMRRYKEAGKYLDLSVGKTTVIYGVINEFAWRYFYCSLLENHLGNKRKSDMFFERSMRSASSYRHVLNHLRVIQRQHPQSAAFLAKCAAKLNDKLAELA